MPVRWLNQIGALDREGSSWPPSHTKTQWTLGKDDAMQLEWTVSQARLYQLYATGLHARDYPQGAAGIVACFRDLGSIQLDPLPVMGRNHDLVIQSRVEGVHPGETLDLIHRERRGFEYWDKALCAITIESFPWFRALMSKGKKPMLGRSACSCVPGCGQECVSGDHC